MKILIVEDDTLTVEALMATLSSQNYAVEVASDGQAAWELIEAFTYDLILLDVTLPKLNGIELCQRLRSHNHQMPILLLTARNSSHDKAIGLDAGADDYVVKPFDPGELTARIRALLRRNQSTTQSVLQWGALRFDPGSCEVTYGTQLLPLTAKEYAIMELLLRNNRRVFSCGAILENLWTFEEIPGDEAVRTHIKGLRQKLKAVGAPADLIETVYGLGYRLKSLETEKSENNKRKSKKENAPSSRTSHATSPTSLEISAEQIGQQTWDAIAEVWQRFQPRVNEQVNILEQAIDALLNQTLTSEIKQKAEQEAHSLAGSLGTFGFEHGTHLARIIEQRLQSIEQHDTDGIQQLHQLVMALKQEITFENSVEPAETESVETEFTELKDAPLLLIVDCDRASVAPLIKEARHWGLRTKVAANLTIAQQQLQQEPPKVVLLDLSIAPDLSKSFSLIAELQQQTPAIPVLVFATQEDLHDRLAVTRLGGRTVLQKSLPAAHILKEITRILHQTDPVRANVLVVDDDPQLLVTVRTLLQPWGLHVTTLNDPNRFWETLEIAAPDLLILDVKMPDINGIELCQVVRNDLRWSGLPIVILTAYSDADTVNQVFAAGADDFVSKPIIGPELVTRIINRLERIQLLKNLAALQQKSERV